MLPGVFLACLQAASQPAATPEHFGVSLASIGDVDGDGLPDFLVGDCPRRTKEPGQGRVWIFSGRDGVVVDVLRGSEEAGATQAWFGHSLAALGDVDGDRVPDFAVGAYCDRRHIAEDRSNPELGYLRVYSGKSRRILFTARGDRPGDGFGCSLARIGDIDADGTTDLIVGAAVDSGRGGGYVRILSGKDGRPLRSIDRRGRSLVDELLDTDRWRGFGRFVVGLGDVDSDGVSDFGVGAPYSEGLGRARGRFVAYSGATGDSLFEVRCGCRCRGSEGTGMGAVGIGDLDSDRVPDLAISCLDHAVLFCSGKDGSTIRKMEDPGRYGYLRGFGASLAALGDVSGDGVGDVAVGCEEVLDSGDHYDVQVFSGADESVLALDGGNKFTVVAAAGDVDGDLMPDLLVARWEEDVVQVISGKTWQPLRTIRRPAETR